MNKRLIKKALKEAKITLDGVELRSDEIEIYCKTKEGEFSPTLTDRKCTKIKKVMATNFGSCSAIKTGYGAWILREGKRPDMGDWNDKSSRWHY